MKSVNNSLEGAMRPKVINEPGEPIPTTSNMEDRAEEAYPHKVSLGTHAVWEVARRLLLKHATHRME